MKTSVKALLAISAASVLIPAAAQAADAEALAVGRCDIPKSTSLFSRLPSGLPSSWTTNTTTVRKGQPLPELMVDGWEPAPGALDVVMTNLLTEAGLSYSGDKDLPTVSWNKSEATLQQTVDQLVSQIGGSWSFDGSTVTVSRTPFARTSSASFQLPEDRDSRLATIDILRGYDLTVDLTGMQAFVSGSESEMGKARKALADAKAITVYDVMFLRGRPLAGRYDWGRLGTISSQPNGAGGNFVFSDPEPEALIQRLVASGDLVEDSAQSVAAPKGWSLAVPPVQCGQGAGELLVGLEGDKQDVLALSGNGVDAKFPGFVMGTTAMAVSPVPADGWIRMMVVRPRTILFASR